MAQKRVKLDREAFSCSICLNLLNDPVTIPCGHNYCLSCIRTHWDGEDGRRDHSCPQCRKSFTPRPVLEKNTMLVDLVEELKKTGLPAAPADQCYAGPEDVACDVCTGRKLKASKSCLTCLVSFCNEHLQPHYDSPAFKKHKLVEPSKNLQENICSQHNEVMKMFCRTDQRAICFHCSLDQHKGHDVVSTTAERTDRQKELEGSHQDIQQRIQDREQDVNLLQQQVEAINRSADKTVKDNVKIFEELIRLIEKKSSDVKKQIRSQQEMEVSRVRELQDKLQQEITELKRRDAELEELSQTEDHTRFLQNLSSVSALSETTSSVNIRRLCYFEDATAAVSDVRDKLQEVLREKLTNISLTVIEYDLRSNSLPEPRTRAEFLKYSRELTLDPNTAHKRMLLSNGNRRVTLRRLNQSHHDHPKRFTDWTQVMSRESLTGRCYWEVEWGQKELDVAVAYNSISRAEISHSSGFGLNGQSWGLQCRTKCNFFNYRFSHNNVDTIVTGPWSFKIGVYLDHSAGVLAFYSISDTMKLLHRVQTTFTKPLHAGLRLHYINDTAEFSCLK